MARETGLPLARGLLAFARAEHDAAADLLYAARAQARRFGGSHAQRDVIDQTLLAAAARGGAVAAGRSLLEERARARADTPLAAWWGEALGRSGAA